MRFHHARRIDPLGKHRTSLYEHGEKTPTMLGVRWLVGSGAHQMLTTEAAIAGSGVELAQVIVTAGLMKL